MVFAKKNNTEDKKTRVPAGKDWIPWQTKKIRPSNYNQEYCSLLIKHMSKGYSFSSFGAVINVTASTLFSWLKKYSEFAEAKEIGRLHELHTWEKIHLQCAATGKGNASAIMWAQKNKFPELYNESQNIININNTTNTVENTMILKWDEKAENKLKELEEKLVQIEILKSRKELSKL